MAVLEHIASIRDSLSSASEILVDPFSPDFQEHLKRWTDINREEPAAIILPSSESECLKVVSVKTSLQRRHVVSLSAKSGAMGSEEFRSVRGKKRWPQRVVNYR